MNKQKVRISVKADEVGAGGQLLAGALLIAFTAAPLYFLIGFWPDRLPTDAAHQIYKYSLFNIEWLENPGAYEGDKIHINTILFLLVAFAGFLGSMIHLASSMTNYIGSEKFKKSWILWYVVKPFTAAGVAVIFYLVLQAGLLSNGETTRVNPFGIVIIAALAGLFTDKASLKLEEIFEIIFKPKDSRPDKIDEITVKISEVRPDKLVIGKDNAIRISGQGINEKLVLKINDHKIENAVFTPEAISFNYQLPEALKDKESVVLTLLGESGEVVFTQVLNCEQENNGSPDTADRVEEAGIEDEQDVEETSEVPEAENQLVKG